MNSNEDSSKQRETGEFYATTYVMTEKEIHEYLDDNIGYECVQKGIENTMIVGNMVKEYSLQKPLKIPYEPQNTEEPKKSLIEKYTEFMPNLNWFAESKTDSDRHLAREIVNAIEADKEQWANEKSYQALNTCMDSIIKSSEANKAHWSAYLLMTRDLIDASWEVGSLVGPARGSGTGFALLALLKITQINPLREEVETYHWRFLNPKRSSPLDIDTDVRQYYKPQIIQRLREKYCGDNESLGVRKVMKVQTLSTFKSKSAMLCAARGLGYPQEVGQFLSAFIEAERGTLHTLKQTYYGDEENGIQPNKEFVNLMNNEYPDIWEVAQGVEGLITGVGSHAGGVIVCSGIITDTNALMKTSSGDIITQWDLHTMEQAGEIKWDLLAIDALEKEEITLKLLLEDGLIEWQGTMRDTYEKYLGVYNIDRNNPEIWEMINDHKIISLFQMEKQSGHQAISIGHPNNLKDLAVLNSAMRLMAQSGASETPLERYGRFKRDINLWYKEMDEYGLSKEEQKIIRKYAEKNYGVLVAQEEIMIALQDPDLGGFDLLYCDKVRKSIAKKKPQEFLALQKEFYETIKQKGLSEKMAHYFWDVLLSMQRGYSFAQAHTLAYSIVAIQESNLAYYYPIEYWNTANLISDSGGEDSTVRYGRIARAIGNFKQEGIVVSLPNINDVHFDFRPKPDTHEIIYGLKPIQGVGAQVAKAIVAHQPYTSIDDFYSKMTAWKNEDKENKFGDTTMISLIKAGCFDTLENKPRTEIMKDFITKLSSPLTSLKMANIEDMAKAELLTEAQTKYELRLFRFRKYLYQDKFLVEKAGKSPSTFFYKLDRKFAEPYFYEHFETLMTEDKDYHYTEDGFIAVKRGSIDKVFDKLTEDFRTTVLTNPENLAKINQVRFDEEWKNRADGTISQWEMQSMCMYYHEHELANVDREAYSIVNFFDLPEEPEISDYYFYRNQQKPRFKLSRIVGTVIDKNSMKSTVTLLTPDGVVDVRFYKGQYIFYDKQIAQVHEDGTKTVLEKSWFQRGNKLMITGFRRGEVFVPRQYKDSIYKHSAQKIMGINEKGILTLVSERVDSDEEG